MTAAMRAKDQARLAPLRMAKAALMNREVEKGRPLDETEAQQVIASLIKQRRDSIEQFRKGGRNDWRTRGGGDRDPRSVPAAATRSGCHRTRGRRGHRRSGATSSKDLGRVMKGVMSRLAGPERRWPNGERNRAEKARFG